MARQGTSEQPASRVVYLLAPFGSILWKHRLLASTALCSAVAALLVIAPAQANPTGGQVVSGSAAIVQTNPNRLDINQSTNSAIINWQSFSINQGQQVNFNQPNSSSIALNRVLGGDASTIAGTLTANGQVWIVNPNGVFFSKTSTVDVAGLVATTSDISNQNFNAGNYTFDKPGNPRAKVVNRGDITVSQAGLAALVAPTVRNSGVIEAKLGKVALASGNVYTLDLYGDDLVKFAVTDQTAAALKAARVENSGKVDADGGTVLLTASEAAGVVDNAINVGGTIDARTTGQNTGRIVVDGNGDNTQVTGVLDASGYGAGQTGGSVDVLGGNVRLASTARIDVSGNAGGGTVHIGGNFHGAGPQANAKTTTVAKGAKIKANAIHSGNGGDVAVWSKDSTSFDGTIEARGGATGGNGGMVETSGGSLGVGASAVVDTRAPKGTAGEWLLDPQNINIASGADNSAGDDQYVDATHGSTLPFDQDAGTTQTIDTGAIDNGLETSNVTLQAGNDINVDGAIDSSGDSAAHNLTLDAGRSINVNASIALKGSFSATANDSADANSDATAAADRQSGPGSFTAAAGTSIDVSTAAGQSIAIAIGPSALNSAGGANYDPGTVTLAGVNAGSSGALTVSGSAGFIGQTTDGLVAGGASSFAAASNAAIALADPNNALTGPVSVNGGGVTLVNGNALDLGASTVAGNLSVTAENGDVTESGPLTVAGTTTMAAPAPGATIMLNDPHNQFGDAINLNASGDIGLANDAGATVLGTVVAGGTLTVDSAGGNLLQAAGGYVQSGWTSSFATGPAGSTIDLTNSGNSFAGPVSLATPGNASLTNELALDLGASSIGGNLAFTAQSGDVTQSGPVTVGGTATIIASAPGANIALNDPNNRLSATINLNASGDIALASDAGATVLGTVVAGGSLAIDSVGGNLVQDPSGIVQSGWTASFSTEAPGSGITLANAGNAIAGSVTLATPGNATLTNGIAIDLGASSIGGNLALTAQSGDVGESGPLTVAGTVTVTTAAPGANISLSDPNNRLSDTINLQASGNVDLTNDAGVTSLGTVVAGGSLTVDSIGGNLSQAPGGIVAAGWTSSFSADAPGSSVALTNAGNALNGPVSVIASGNADLTNSIATTLADVRAGGSLGVTVTNGDLAQTSTGTVEAGWTSAFATEGPGATITLTNPGNFLAGPIALNTTGPSGDVALTNNTDTALTTSSVGGGLTIDAENHLLDLESNLAVTSLTLSGRYVFNTDAPYTLAVNGGLPAGTLGDAGDLENVTVNGQGGSAAAGDFILTPAANGRFIINGSNASGYAPPADPFTASRNLSLIQGIVPALASANAPDQSGGGSAPGSTAEGGSSNSGAQWTSLFQQISELDESSGGTPTVIQPEQAATAPSAGAVPQPCADDAKNLTICVGAPGSSPSP